MPACAGCDLSYNFERPRIDHSNAARFVVCVARYPQIFLVGLQGDARRLDARVDVIRDGPTPSVDHRHLINERQADEELFALATQDPVFAGTLHHYQSQQLASAKTQQWINNGDVGTPIQSEDVIRIQVDIRTRTHAAS